MKVALKEDVEKLGKKGDLKNVADGYARNFLIPRGLVEIATQEVIKRTEKIREAREAETAKQKDAMTKLAEKITGQKIEIKAKAKNDKLFGSISAAKIAKAITEQTKTAIDKKMIVLAKPIKKVGDYNVRIKLADEVETDLVIKVAAE